MANGNEDSGRAAQRRLMERELAEERKKKEPTVMGSLKEGAKVAARRAGRLLGMNGTKKAKAAPTEGMGGYGAKGDAERKRYIEGLTERLNGKQL